MIQIPTIDTETHSRGQLILLAALTLGIIIFATVSLTNIAGITQENRATGVDSEHLEVQHQIQTIETNIEEVAHAYGHSDEMTDPQGVENEINRLDTILESQSHQYHQITNIDAVDHQTGSQVVANKELNEDDTVVNPQTGEGDWTILDETGTTGLSTATFAIGEGTANETTAPTDRPSITIEENGNVETYSFYVDEPDNQTGFEDAELIIIPPTGDEITVELQSRNRYPDSAIVNLRTGTVNGDSYEQLGTEAEISTLEVENGDNMSARYRIHTADNAFSNDITETGTYDPNTNDPQVHSTIYSVTTEISITGPQGEYTIERTLYPGTYDVEGDIQ